MVMPFSSTWPDTEAPVFRFAPSPNGFLHLGHARSALINAELAMRHQGRFLLRIEDIDLQRSRPEYVDAIAHDLAWLGLTWEQPVLRQSTRFHAYSAALVDLEAQGLVYPCFCSRGEIMKALGARGGEQRRDPDGTPLYPMTCKHLSTAERHERRLSEPFVLRLDSEKALAQTGKLVFANWNPETNDRDSRTADPEKWGDVVLKRKDTPTSYHLAVVVDDAFQGVTHVVRGADLAEATHLHVLLQALLGLPSPLYHHHALVLDETGQKLSKSIASTSIRDLRLAGARAAQLRERAMRSGA
jgi:glutamyl-Q tRNA(Asp) synthetase